MKLTNINWKTPNKWFLTGFYLLIEKSSETMGPVSSIKIGCLKQCLCHNHFFNKQDVLNVYPTPECVEITWVATSTISTHSGLGYKY